MSVDLDSLLNAGKKIYVKNTSRPMGNIILTFVTANGKAVPRPIPRTWVPVCLTDTVSPDVIRESNDLRQFIDKGILKLMDPELAQDELSSEDARDEVKRLSISDFAAQATPTQRTVDMSTAQTYEANLSNPMDPAQGMQPDPVNNRVKSTLLRVESKDITEREAVAEFRIMQEELSKHDLTYIISLAEGEGPLKRFALQILAAESASVDPDVVKQDTEEDPPEDPAVAAAARENQQV